MLWGEMLFVCEGGVFNQKKNIKTEKDKKTYLHMDVDIETFLIYKIEFV